MEDNSNKVKNIIQECHNTAYFNDLKKLWNDTYVSVIQSQRPHDRAVKQADQSILSFHERFEY